MKLEALQRLQSFQTIPRATAPPVSLIKSRGDKLNNKGLLEEVHGASTDPQIQIGFQQTSVNIGHGSLTFYVFLEGKCQGNVVFDFIDGSSLTVDAGINLTLPAVPHAVLDKKVQGKGIVSFMYRYALDKNISLISDAHTPDAARVWESIASNPKYHLYHVERGKVIPEETVTSFKVLTKKKI